MNQWTDPARAKLEDYLSQMRQKLASSGADINEVTDDLKRHIEEEVSSRRLGVVTEQDVGQILARIGTPEQATAVAEPEPTPVANNHKPSAHKPTPPSWWLIIFGVILPFATIGFEFFTGACAGEFFDPVPTIWHLLLTVSVPVINLLIWLALRRGELGRSHQLGWASGFAIGISSIYALLFLPLTPFAVIGVFFFGFGLIPLGPLFSCISAAVLRGHLRKARSDAARLSNLWAGIGLGIASLALLGLPSIITSMGLQMAVSDSSAENMRGIGWLRSWGQEEEILRACYGRAGRAGQMYSWGTPINPEAARTIYYRVYGRAFNTVPPPKLYAGRARWNLVEEEFTWDNDQGGDAVAGRVRGVSLAASRQDGLVDPSAALAYLEWTLEFKNVSSLQREARAQIALPPGAVVSRLTLWIDGEEREAAFGGRSQVKTAYKQVVQQRRDPVLVTTCGPDRVMVQCFPIQPNGGTMKLRMGITAPLTLTSSDIGCLRWPYIIERNFTIPESFQHSLWVQASQPIETIGSKLKSEPSRPGTYALHGRFRDDELPGASNVLRVKRPIETTKVWTRETREGDGVAICQSIVTKPASAPERVVVVVDGTQGVEQFYRGISAAMSKLPPGIDFALLLARDGCEEIIPLQQGNAGLYQRVALRKFNSPGGHDNAPALIRAWELAAQAKRSAIVWVHGPQPVVLDSVEELRQHFERSSNPPLLFELQTHTGPNRVVEALDGIKAVQSILRLGDPGDDLGRLFSSWSGQGNNFELVRERMSIEEISKNPPPKETSLHLARLWAAEEIARLSSARHFSEAMQLATRYQLVTPVSGAVVLETKQQYDQAGLKPVAPESVPVVPEPSAGALLVIGFVLACCRHLRKRRNNPPAMG
ncbi:MAG TPA: VIT domain-containing protein [Clostridia bacterium]|nr:VIT domain-containing protein [Clostridia bacterium]